MRRIAFITLGCRVNQAETARLMAQFIAAGFTVVLPEEPCDVIVIHGCAVTREAERQSRQAARAALRRIPSPLVILAGCAAEAVRRFGSPHSLPSSVLTAGQAEKQDLPALVKAAFGYPALPPDPPPTDITPRFPSVRAWLKIQDGCNFRCAYCIVPQLRGPAVSRPYTDILDEAHRLLEAGTKELSVTGINIGCWRNGTRRLPDLLADLASLEGLTRLRIGSLELSTVEDAVIALMAETPRIAPYLHIPLQSGDDAILHAMGRRYSTAQFRKTVETACSRIPNLGIGTDVIAGFPGENEASFSRTLALLDSLPVHNIHAFPYSERPRTSAAARKESTPSAERKSRVRRLNALAKRKQAKAIAQRLGSQVHVLIEEVSSDGTGRGWSGEYLEAVVSNAPTPGSLVSVRVLAPLERGFRGEVQ